MTQLYEPGSVFKLVTFSAALQDGLINPATPSSPCPIRSTWTAPRSTTGRPTPDREADRHPDSGPVVEHRDLSSIAEGLGEQRLLAQVKNLGFGKSTGLEFPGAVTRTDGHGCRMGADRLRVAAHRQVDAVSALQVLDAYNAVANGGTFVQPKLVEATVDQSGGVTGTGTVADPPRFSPPVDSELTTMLEQVVSEGTGRVP